MDLKQLLSDITPPANMSEGSGSTDSYTIMIIILAIVSIILIIITIAYLMQKQKKRSTLLSKPEAKKEITCPRCGSKEIVIIPEHEKSIVARIMFLSLLLIEIGIAIKMVANEILKHDDGSQILFAIIGVGMVICYIIITVVESNTHVEGVCKDCGFTWRHQ